MAPPLSSPVARERTTANLVRQTMNKFLKRRVPEPLNTNVDALNALSAAPPAQTSPPLKKSGTGRWRKSRKAVEERPEVNLDLALPSNDDFRTSLFMPALSARFSMLREQDDPTTKLGKASDDSVLQPRRRSRMDLALDDIAEVDVASTKSSIRPPFADHRQHSYASEEGYSSERDSSHGSVMNRARPGEGNTMFGGRQRVYMIPNSASASSRSLGRVVYEDDLGTSLFQQYRRQRKEQQAARESNGSHGFDFGLDQIESTDQDDGDAAFPNDYAKDLSHSPSFSSSGQKRSTDSGSHSEARSSTAATSIASQPVTTTSSPAKPLSSQLQQPPATVTTSTQPLKRADTKTRRLYEQGLDQHLQEQQSSALNRLNSIHRQRTLSNKQPSMYLHSAKSASNLQDKSRQPVYALPTHEAIATPPLFIPFGPGGLSNSASPSPAPSAPGTPVTPQTAPDFDENFALLQALEPGDRGKATAMGAFNKPKQSFDEQQYLERQRQLQRSTSTAATRKDSGTHAVAQAQLDGAFKAPYASEPIVPALPPSLDAPRSREPSSAQASSQRVSPLVNTAAGASAPDGTNFADTHRTFFGTISGSDSEDEDQQQQERVDSSAMKMPDYGYGTQHGKWQPTVLPAVSEHPALRSQRSRTTLSGAEDTIQEQPARSNPTANFSRPEPPRIQTSEEEEEVESPTLGNSGPAGALNGLMQHLRQRSNVSSITQKSDVVSMEITGPAELTATNLDLVNRPIQSTAYSESRVGSYAISNPWDLEDIDTGRAERRESRASVSPIDGDHLVPPFDSYASSSNNRHSAVSALENEAEGDGAQQNESQTQHTRDTSTATQQDREAFDNELAARRLAIQENIRKSRVERENQARGVSPARSISTGRKPFQMLRTKQSRESMDDGRVSDFLPSAPSKALKLVGADAANANGASVAGSPLHDAGVQAPYFSRPRERSASRPSVRNEQLRASQRSERDVVRQMQQSRSRENSESHPLPQLNRSPPSSAGERSRANSTVTSGRSRSRTGPYRDDLEKAMVEGTGSSTASVPDAAVLGLRELTPRSTPDLYQSPFEPQRARSGSRAATTTNYFDLPALHSLHTGSKERLINPGALSPQGLGPNAYSPIVSPAPRSPAASFAQNMTPPLSGNTTPLQSSFVPPPPILPSAGRPGGVLRKRAVSKGDISEPTLVSSTSSVDLVDLPEGASLKNGMDEPPPVPPINPARRATKKILGIGRKESQDSTASQGRRSKTPETGLRKSPDPEFSYDMPQAYHSRSATLSAQSPGSKQSLDQSPGVAQNGSSSMRASPEQHERSSPPAKASMDGAMF